MTLTTYLVDINSIEFTQENAYNPELVEELANLILEQGGTTQPLIVTQVKMDGYKLVSGELVLLAAIRAHEIDEYFEMIRVIIQAPNTDLTAEAKLIEKIESTAQSIDPELDETPVQTVIEVKNEETSAPVVKSPKIAKKEPVKDGKWLIVEGEIVDYGEFSELNKIDHKLHKKNPKINTEIISVHEIEDLIDKKKWYLEKLAEIQQQLDAHEKFLK